MKRFLLACLASLFGFCAHAADPRVEIKTSLGTMIVELNPAKAPKTVENFLSYAKDGFYNGTIFHRVIDGFMVQGGGFLPDMNEKSTRAPIANEAANGLKNELGTLAMARTPDPHSASSQFFINLKHNDFLDYPGQDGWGYAVFGKVVDGLSVLEKIAKVKTGMSGMHGDVPATPVLIKSVRILPQKNK